MKNMVKCIWYDTSFVLITSLNSYHCVCLTTSSLSVCKYSSIVTCHNWLDQTESSFVIYRSLCRVSTINSIKCKSTSVFISLSTICIDYYLINCFIYFNDVLRAHIDFFCIHRSTPDHDSHTFVTTSRFFVLHFLIKYTNWIYII